MEDARRVPPHTLANESHVALSMHSSSTPLPSFLKHCHPSLPLFPKHCHPSLRSETQFAAKISLAERGICFCSREGNSRSLPPQTISSNLRRFRRGRRDDSAWKDGAAMASSSLIARIESALTPRARAPHSRRAQPHPPTPNDSIPATPPRRCSPEVATHGFL